MKKIILSIILLLLVVPFVGIAAECKPGYNGTELCTIKLFGGDATDIPELITVIIVWFGSCMFALVMIMLMYSGAKMIFSQGDPTALKEAKSSFKYAIVGSIVTLFSYTIVSMVEYFIGVNDNEQEKKPTFFFNPLKETEMRSFIDSTIMNFLSIIGVIAVLFIIWNGFKYMTAFGNEERTKNAKNGITWAVVGLICIMLSYTIVRVLQETVWT